MSKKPLQKKTSSPVPGYTFIKKAGGIKEFQLKSNGLRVLFVPRPGTGVITTNITYLVGARDEARGETGLAHMLEHMLFKPTVFDKKAGRDSGAMHFERNVGCILNANTWRDRTTYYFSYPIEHFDRDNFLVLFKADPLQFIKKEDHSDNFNKRMNISKFEMDKKSHLNH